MDVNETSPHKRGMTQLRVLLTAGIPQRFDFAGDYIHCLTAPITDLKCRFDDGEQVPIYEGVGFRRYYKTVELQSATGQSVVMLVGFGSVFDGRATANVNVTATVAAGNTVNNGGDVNVTHSTRALLLAADTTRTYAVIANPSTNTVTVRIGSVTVNNVTGIPLEPGESLPLATTAAVYAYNPDGAVDVTISASSIEQI